MKEALFYEKLAGKKVRCLACNQFCAILDKRRGVCGVRENRDGKLYSLTYGKVIARHMDPIEKKPFFHFLPGSVSFSFSAMGCNFCCANCQNADISQVPPEESDIFWGEEMSPEEIVREASESGCQSISCTYTEPTVFVEYALETMRLAKEKGLKNCWVSNGYMSHGVLEKIFPLLDAINVDLKFFDDKTYRKVCGARLAPILENLKSIKKAGVWLEITTLLIPSLTDAGNQLEKIAEFIAKELGKETPWHISRFYPTYKLSDFSPTPTEVMDRAYEAGKKAGLKYVYVGNMPEGGKENTCCPKCGQLDIERSGYRTKRHDKDGMCGKCGESLDLVL